MSSRDTHLMQSRPTTNGRTPSSRSVPFGPGGRPLGGVRPYLFVMFVVTGVVILPVMLADRAPRVARAMSRWINNSDSALADAAGMLRLPETAFEVHVLSWAVAALFAGLIAWSWKSFVALGLAVLTVSLTVEAAQDILTDTRTSQVDDAIANSIGVAIGLTVAAAANLVYRALMTSRFPAGDDGDEGD